MAQHNKRKVMSLFNKLLFMYVKLGRGGGRGHVSQKLRRYEWANEDPLLCNIGEQEHCKYLNKCL